MSTYGILTSDMGTTFDFISGDGTRVVGWRNDGAGLPVVISNGLGTAPAAWPTIAAADSGFRTTTWYYRGTGGGDRPSHPDHVRIEDHVADLLALLDHDQIDRAVLCCWSLGVNVGFELARRHPDRVAGVMAVAGVPGGTFRAMFGPLGVPRRFRHGLGVGAARLGRRIGRPLSWVSRHIPLNAVTATIINHSGFVLPRASADRLVPALEEFRQHDFEWYFTLAVGAAEHAPMDLSFIDVPVTLVAGKYDVLTSMHDMVEAAAALPHAELHLLPGSHFLPLEFPDELARELRRLAERARVTGDRREAAVVRRSSARAAARGHDGHPPTHRSPS